MNFIPINDTDVAVVKQSTSNPQITHGVKKPIKRDHNGNVTPMSARSRKKTPLENDHRVVQDSHLSVKKLKVCSGPGIVRLHKEIKAFYNDALPTLEEKQMRERVITKITDIIKNLWSGAKVELFGSYVTGLYLPTSDVDLVVFGRWASRPLYTLRDELVRRGVCTEQSTQVLDRASVPILKIKESLTQVKVDISFNMTNGTNTAKMIKGYIEEFPSLPYLTLVLKQFLYQRDLNEVYTGGLSSYSLILLIVSFLQLQCRGEGRRADVNYGVLLMEFFELYGINFNYSRVGITVRNGGRYIRKPDGSAEGQLSIYIEDPVVQNNDVGRGTYNTQQIQSSFCHAYHVLSRRLTVGDTSQSKGSSLLDSVIPLSSSTANR